VIVEIGPRPYVARAYANEAAFFPTDFNEIPDDVRVLGSLAALSRALAQPDLELIVCHPNFSSPWGVRHLNRSIVSRKLVQGRSPLLRAFGPELLRGTTRPLVVIDHEDLPVIARNNLFLLDRCRLWFKRELPADHWRVFLKTAHANLPTPRFRINSRNQARVAKLRPISIGLPLGAEALLPAAPAPKTGDVFYSGLVEGSSTVRTRGLAELKALAAQGVVVDIPDQRLPPAEFYARCAAAWLVWSPEGLGWDCFRHYEAPACGSVPLINHPPVDRHAPLLGGQHALYYDVEPGGLTRAVTAALADQPALARMAEAGRTQVLANHTPAALARYVVESMRTPTDRRATGPHRGGV
jgi:hypothetical protein